MSLSDGAGTSTDCYSTSSSLDESDDGGSGSESDSACSDLEELYESFDYEASISMDDVPMTTHSTSLPLAHETPLYRDAQLTLCQSNLLISQYSLRHSLTTKALTELLLLLSVHLPPNAIISRIFF